MLAPEILNWKPATSTLLLIYIEILFPPKPGSIKQSPILVDNELPPGPERITLSKQTSPFK